MANRLASATSPYLLQHAQNPVDWWEWGPDAFEEARQRDVPVLLSVGYAACHWCHVMAHESFEDEATAAYMNEHFVNIKVDREERPDVDAVYMAATTAMTGSGGWPMTVVLDHDGNPFFAGTYFPDMPRHGQPAFTQVLQALSEAWTQRRSEIGAVAENVRQHLTDISGADGAPGDWQVDVAAAVETLAGQFDPMAGGFGGAPKFPPSMVLEFLRRVSEVDSRVPQMLSRTVAAMAGGGMYDQIGGGFARYAVDRGWVVPHFEKMLYDNAQLIGLYARLGTELGDRVARESADWMIRELGTAEGGFASALDADSEGVEGKFYVWTPAELVEVLGAEDGAWAAEVFEVTEAGTFEEGASTLQLLHRPDDTERLESVKTRLLAAREDRVRPARDDKVVAAWNGLAIGGLVDAGVLLGEPRYVDAAIGAGGLLWDKHCVGLDTPPPSGSGGSASERPSVEPGERQRAGVETNTVRLLRVSRDGTAGAHAGVLEDYGCVAGGFLSLVQATGDSTWLDRATALLDTALTHFRAEDGGFYDTADDAEALVTRPRDPSDNASPGGTSAMVHALVTAHALTGEGRFRTAAEEALAATSNLITKAPRFAGWSLAAAATMAEGPLEIAVVGPPGPDRDALAAAARRKPGAVVVVADEAREDIPLLSSRTPVNGKAAAYVCRGFVCERPVTEVADLERTHT
ncbi:thioredoxin domain-containing protein [Nocardioides sp.]|uniref:thioredoxin domain-containing protein n=1 Tax=Nocardioides sp. TaxID=35761 RepID=UPI0019A605F0|nr:thioredoxin domain-containing protein [Nocardioides sp.]MBC7278300.1 thioredoxin domain-containing protein [Nocardioides sp.]